MGALLFNLHGSISSRQMDGGKVKVRAASMPAEIGIKHMVLKLSRFPEEGAEAVELLYPASSWEDQIIIAPWKLSHSRLRSYVA